MAREDIEFENFFIFPACKVLKFYLLLEMELALTNKEC